jgi:uncharacterized protein YigA (DUF484 family)
VLLGQLQHEFMIPQAAVRVWDTPTQSVREALRELTCTQGVSDDAKSFAGSLSLPYCGVNAGFEAARWLADASTVTSVAMIPLHHQGHTYGLLVLGSPDPTRYTADMGVDFLQQVGETTSAALARLLG